MSSWTSGDWYVVTPTGLRVMDRGEYVHLRHAELRLWSRECDGEHLIMVAALLPGSAWLPFALRLVVGKMDRRRSICASPANPVEDRDRRVAIGDTLGVEASEMPLCGGLNPRIWFDD